MVFFDFWLANDLGASLDKRQQLKIPLADWFACWLVYNFYF